MPRRRLLTGVAGLTLVTLAGCGAAPASAPSAATTPWLTKPVRRGDLTDTTTVTATIGYGAGSDLVAGLSGILTSSAEPGAVIGNGEVLYRLDDLPVIRFAGALPAWRDLAPGAANGRDIEQLERALIDLGHARGLDLTVDKRWTWLTTIAVQRWQQAVGLERTGSIPLGRIVFTPQPVRVAQQLLRVGDRVGPDVAVLGLTATARTVTVPLKANQARLAPVRAKVAISLPDGVTAGATVTDVTVVPPAEQGKDSTLAVTVTADTDGALDSLLDGASVRVTFTTTLAVNVLLVPVTALVALPDGGYGVQRAGADGTTSMINVVPGRFSGTMVEITGGDLAEADKVVVTS